MKQDKHERYPTGQPAVHEREPPEPFSKDNLTEDARRELAVLCKKHGLNRESIFVKEYSAVENELDRLGAKSPRCVSAMKAALANETLLELRSHSQPAKKEEPISRWAKIPREIALRLATQLAIDKFGDTDLLNDFKNWITNQLL